MKLMLRRSPTVNSSNMAKIRRVSGWTNPFNANQVQYVSFRDTRVIVFWSKNPKPIMRFLPEIDAKGVNYYFQFTLNDYESDRLEPNVPLRTSRKLAGGLIVGYRLAISSRIFGAPHRGFSFLSRTINSSTSKGVLFGWECGARLRLCIARPHPERGNGQFRT